MNFKYLCKENCVRTFKNISKTNVYIRSFSKNICHAHIRSFMLNTLLLSSIKSAVMLVFNIFHL